MGLSNGFRRRPGGPGDGVLAALLISPRDFLYTRCAGCNLNLYYTYPGEPCPFCDRTVGGFITGRLPTAATHGGQNNDESRASARERRGLQDAPRRVEDVGPANRR